MSNDKPYTINVEVPTKPITSEEPREVRDILITGLADLFNSIARGLRQPPFSNNNTNVQPENEGEFIDAEIVPVSSCDKQDSVIYLDSDQDEDK
tara:strand:+ start:287 stop:568 length:282 start_codon:yes stop_codon:yes gene_type:complete